MSVSLQSLLGVVLLVTIYNSRHSSFLLSGPGYHSGVLVWSISLNIHDQFFTAIMWPLRVSAFLLCPPFMVSTAEASAAGTTTGLNPVPQFLCRAPPASGLCSPTVVQLRAGCCSFVLLQPALCQNCAVGNVGK